MLVQLEAEQFENPSFVAFLHSLQESKLRYYASELQNILEMNTLESLEAALLRAMNVCRHQQLDLAEHFKPIYRCKESGVVKDWKLSPLAWCLVMINADPANPAVARMQLTLLAKSIEAEAIHI